MHVHFLHFVFGSEQHSGVYFSCSQSADDLEKNCQIQLHSKTSIFVNKIFFERCFVTFPIILFHYSRCSLL